MARTQRTPDPDLSPIPRTLVASDGRLLAADLFRPRDTPVRAQVVIHGATAVPREYYEPFARYLASHGYEALIYDYRGVGGSALSHASDDDATMTDWFKQDAPAAVRTLRHGSPNVPFFAIGHSFGGQIVAALDGVPQPDAVVTMGAQRGYWAAFAPAARPRMWLNWFVLLPALTSTLGYLPAKAGLGVDMPAGVVREWAAWCKRPDYYLSAHPELRDRLASFRGRLLALSTTDDSFAPRANVEWLIAQHRSAAVEHVRFTPKDAGATSFGHFGFFRTRHAAAVWPEIVGHFEEALGQGQRPRSLGHAMPTPRPRSDAEDIKLHLEERELFLDLQYGRV
jgi:predicted alpha/beta hydrolase